MYYCDEVVLVSERASSVNNRVVDVLTFRVSFLRLGEDIWKYSEEHNCTSEKEILSII